MPAITAPSGFSDEEVVRLIETLEGADSVELKRTVPDSDRRSAVTALGLDPLEAQISPLEYFAAGPAEKA